MRRLPKQQSEEVKRMFLEAVRIIGDECQGRDFDERGFVVELIANNLSLAYYLSKVALGGSDKDFLEACKAATEVHHVEQPKA